MPKTKLDEVTLAIYGECDDGFGVNYADEEPEEEIDDDDDLDGLDRDWKEIMSGRVR
jgi:hypothetical protein